jgi:hypothetical protein
MFSLGQLTASTMFLKIFQKVQRAFSRKLSATTEKLTFSLVMMVLYLGFFGGGLKVVDLDGKY